MNTAKFHFTNAGTFGVLLLIYFGLTQLQNWPVIWAIPGIVLAFALLNALFYRMLVRANQKSPQRFVTVFTGVIGIKLLTALVFVLLYLVMVKTHIWQVVTALFIAYVLFTIVLIRSVLSATPPRT